MLADKPATQLNQVLQRIIGVRIIDHNREACLTRTRHN